MLCRLFSFDRSYSTQYLHIDMRVPQQLYPADSFDVGDVHEPRHELDRLELSDALGQQGDRLLRFVAEEDVRVLVDHVHDPRVFHVAQVLQCFLVGLLTEVVHHDHLEVVLPVGEPDQVPDAAMGLHDQVD